MKKTVKLLSVLLAAIIILSPVYAVAAGVAESGVTNVQTPVSSDGARLLWSRKFGSSYKNAPSTMAVVGSTLVVMSGKKMYKLHTESGETLGCADMTEPPSFGYTPPAVYDGVIYCPLENGTIQAFDYETLDFLWVYRDSLGGQSLSPIMYSDGCIYTGFWNDEDEYANFVCIDTENGADTNGNAEKTGRWSYKSKGGFYWAGCAFSGDYVIVGTDDGTLYSNKPSRLMCFDKKSGQVCDTLDIIGDQRSGITANGDMLYFVTKAGYLYGVRFENGSFDKKNVKRMMLGGASTSTPVIYGRLLFVGVQGANMREGTVKAVGLDTFGTVSSASANGYPQNAVLISDAYLNSSDRLYVYSTYNAPPGGIDVFTFSSDGKFLERTELFVPPDGMTEYCISSIVCDENGTLFYKNDSGSIFAVGKRSYAERSFFALLRRLMKMILTCLRRFFG